MGSSDAAPARTALRRAAALGPFCAVDADPGPGAVDLRDGDRLLDARTAAVAAVLGPAAGRREVHSLVHLGVVARVLSPALAAALVAAVLPVPGSVLLQPVGSNPVPMTWSGVRGVDVAVPGEVAAALVEHWLVPLVGPWSDAVAARSVSRRALTGNVVSALHGTAVVVAGARPDLAAPARAVLDALLAHGPLVGTGGWRPDGSFARRSCCMLHRLPAAVPCADCVLVGAPA
ncbi:(2Fe-2S)-binding protein [Klenkia sp. LSe6-5]|uniref:(2Fe-2S)-binding protein n=1 Tax=Klenkia sesuvii TaxID=3103137 RepID=A0ABU8DSL6_9ACTN